MPPSTTSALPRGTFALAIDPDLPLVRADAAQLERAFANLLENAARYCGRPARLGARPRGRHARSWCGSSTAGPGIPPRSSERIFEPFYRAARRRGHRGSGLGLAIARGFVEANGGRVWLESLPGQGTTSSSSSRSTEPRAGGRRAASDRQRVLVVRRRAARSCAR